MIVSSDATSSKVASDIIHGADFLLDPTRATLQSRHGFHRPYTRGGGYSLASHGETIRDEIRVESISKYRVHSEELNFILYQTIKPERVPVPGGFYERIKTPIAQRCLLLHTPRVSARSGKVKAGQGQGSAARWANLKQDSLAEQVCGASANGNGWNCQRRGAPAPRPQGCDAHRDEHGGKR